MKRILTSIAVLSALWQPAKAADSTVTALTAASALTGPELFYCVQSAADRKCTATQLQTLVLNGGPITPQGRISLTTGVAITTTDVTGATAHFYVPGVSGNLVPLFNGTNWVPTALASQLTQATTDTTKSPTAVGASLIYDIYIWSDSGTLRATRSAAWASDTNRGTGSGTAEVDFTTALPTNKFAITNGPAANRGTLVGSVRSNASSQLVDSAAFRWVSNIYNAWPRPMQRIDPAATWLYNSGTYQQANANTANQLDLLSSLGTNYVSAVVQANAASSVATNVEPIVGIDIDTLNTTNIVNNISSVQAITGANGVSSPVAQYKGYPGLGRHTLIWKEAQSPSGSGTTTWVGTLTQTQSGIYGETLN